MFGRQMSLMAAVLIVLSVAASAALLAYFGRITGAATVQQSVLVDGNDYMGINKFSWDGNSYPQGIWIETHDLENKGPQDTPVDFKTTCKNSAPFDGSSPSTAEDIAWSDRCEGITTRYVEYFDDAGADLSSYVAPAVCDVTVTTTIQSAIDSASTGDVVCVPAGTYDEHVNINKAVTLAALGAAEISNGIYVGVSDVKVSGFILKTTDVSAHDNSGVFLASGISNVEISYNDIGQRAGAVNPRGIVLVYGGTYNDIEIKHNKLHDLMTGIYSNKHTGIVDIRFNTFEGYVAGIGGAMGALVEYNEFDAAEAIGFDDDFSGSRDLTLRYNNFNGDALVKNYGVSPQDALDNWWGTDGIDAIGASADWLTKSDFVLAPGEKDVFGIITEFSNILAPDTYNMEMQVTA